MHTKNSIIYQSCYWHIVEQIYKSPPKFERIAALAFIKEAKDTGNFLTFMISTEQKNIVWIFDFISKK
jgi:hypothetical protein